MSSRSDLVSLAPEQLGAICGGNSAAYDALAGCSALTVLNAPTALGASLVPGVGEAAGLGVVAGSCLAGAGMALRAHYRNAREPAPAKAGG
jgi:NaMN:DMB phosphoribosyltransferase